MSNTEAVSTRFWRTMAERYGDRWLTSYGTQPTLAWRELLDPYTPADIHRALALLDTSEATREHPPTEPAFRSLLKQAARNGAKLPENPAEARRGYWRSTIIHQVSAGLGFNFTTFEPVLVANKFSLGRACRDLLDEVDTLEAETGQRTSGQEQFCERRCREIVVAFRELKAAQVAA